MHAFFVRRLCLRTFLFAGESMDGSLFYKNLRYLRKKKHISQEAMGEKLKIKRSTYAHMEKHSKNAIITPLLQKVVFEEFGYTIDKLLNTDLQSPTSNMEESQTSNTHTVKEIDKALIQLDEITLRLKKIKNDLIINTLP